MKDQLWHLLVLDQEVVWNYSELLDVFDDGAELEGEHGLF